MERLGYNYSFSSAYAMTWQSGFEFDEPFNLALALQRREALWDEFHTNQGFSSMRSDKYDETS